jgi:hypothetical protein
MTPGSSHKNNKGPRRASHWRARRGTDLHVGDELICVTKQGLALARVMRLHRKAGTVAGFFPEDLPAL